VSNTAAVRAAAAAAGPVDHLVHCAGIAPLGRLLDQPAADIERAMRTNYLGTVHVTQAVVPRMVEQGRGTVIVIASIAAWIPLTDIGAYGASKAAVAAFCEVLTAECRSTGVRAPASGVLKVHDQVPGGLGHPRRGRVRRRAQHPDPASVVLDHRKHEHPCPRQGDRLEEVTGQQGLCLGLQEAGPGRGRAPWRRVDPRLLQDLPHGRGSHLQPEHEQLTVHPTVPPPGILPDQAQHQGTDRAHGTGLASAPGPGLGGMPPPDQVTMPAQHRIGPYQQPHPAKRPWPQPVQQRRQQGPVRRREAHLLPA
jgi:hypothetical protein